MARAGDQRCPCKSGRKYKRCCQPWHQGRPAPTPQALMRSRFSAYALGLVDHIVATTDPTGPMWQADLDQWRTEIQQFCERTRFQHLRVVDHSQDGDDGHVHFVCTLTVGDEAAEVGEHSRFTRLDGRWLYHSGTR